MKKAVFLAAILISGLIIERGNLSAAGPDYSKYFITDSAVVFSWSETVSNWVPASMMLYSYQDGKINSLLTIDFNSRADQARTDYVYNAYDLLETETNYYFSGGAWVTATRNLYFYDSQNRVSEIHVQKWVSSAWVYDRIQNNYLYDGNNKQLEFQTIYWRSNAWTPPKTDYSTYDTEGKLIQREGLYSTGAYDYRIIYTYDVYDILKEAYAQYPSLSDWANWWLASYQHNPCGQKTMQVQYAGSGTSWVPRSKTLFYSHFRKDLVPDRRIAICHKGKSMYVHREQLADHLAHGDCIGFCLADQSTALTAADPVKTTLQDIPVKIFPNPAVDYLMVKKTNHDFDISSIELFDMNGVLLRTVSAGFENELTIHRNDLKAGSYILRINGDKSYSTSVIFK